MLARGICPPRPRIPFGSGSDSIGPVAAEIDKMCAPVRGNAPANWGDTTEGRLCTAAKQLAFTTPPPGGVKSDGRTFRPGTH